MERPVGIAQHLAREQNQIGLAVADDLVGLGGAGDHADGGGRNFGLAADPRRERNLIARADRDLRLLDIAARGAVDRIDAEPLQLPRERDRLLEVPAAFGPIGRGNAHENGTASGSAPRTAATVSRSMRVRFSNPPP